MCSNCLFYILYYYKDVFLEINCYFTVPTILFSFIYDSAASLLLKIRGYSFSSSKTLLFELIIKKPLFWRYLGISDFAGIHVFILYVLHLQRSHLPF